MTHRARRICRFLTPCLVVACLVVACLVEAPVALAAETSPYLRLRVLVVVYPNTFTATATPGDVEHLWDEVDEVVGFYWRGSDLRLHLAVESVVIERELAAEDFRVFGVSQDAYWLGHGTVVEDLLALGYPEDTYDAIVAFYAFERGPGHYNQYKGATLGVSQGVRPLGAAGYVGIPMDYDPLTWNRTLEHEFMHVVTQLFRESTYPELPDNLLHNPQFLVGVYDSDDSWIPWLLRWIPEESYFDSSGIWGSVEGFPDADGDGVPDTDSTLDRLPITEELLGSSPSLRDSDEDGLSDREEAAAAFLPAFTERRRGLDPTQSDSDDDGVGDAFDAAPLVGAKTSIEYGTPTIDGSLGEGAYTEVVSFSAEDPEEVSATLWMAWDTELLYLALEIDDEFVSTRDTVFVHVDAASDGFLYQGDENYEIAVSPSGATDDPSRIARTWLSDKTLDDTVLPAADVLAAYSSDSESWRVELAIPARRDLGLPGRVGASFRLQVFVQDRDGLLLADEKRHFFAFGRYTPVTLAGEDCNENGIPDDVDIATGAAADENMNDVPDSCDPKFVRGEVNGDGALDISDPVTIFEWLFLGAHEVGCRAAVDVNTDGAYDISDGIWLLEYSFLGGPPPAAPYPECGIGTAQDAELGCEASSVFCGP